MTWLLRGNILVAAMIPDHPHYDRVHRWLATVRGDGLAISPVSEGTLLRMHMHCALDKSTSAAWVALASIHAHC